MTGPIFPTARLPLLSLWIFFFVFFTALQLRFNKTPFTVDGVPLCSVSDLIEFFVPVFVVPLYWAVWFSSPIRNVGFTDALLMVSSRFQIRLLFFFFLKFLKFLFSLRLWLQCCLLMVTEFIWRQILSVTLVTRQRVSKKFATVPQVKICSFFAKKF